MHTLPACVLFGIVGSMVACGEPTTNGDSLGDSNTASAASSSSSVATTVPFATTAPFTGPPTVDSDVADRLANLSQQHQALLDAVESGLDWRGSLTGQLFEQPLGPPGWKLCFEILESYPEQCGSHVELEHVPSEYISDPASFDVQTGVGSEEPVVVISANPVMVTGTFDHTTALFHEDGDIVAPPTTVSPFAQARLDALPPGEPFDSIASSYSNGVEWHGSLTGTVVQTLAVSSLPRLCFEFDTSASNPCPTYVEVSAPDALSLASSDAFSIVEDLGQPAGPARFSNEPITIEGTFTYRGAFFLPD
jgi:hypothetical protein